MDGLSHLFDQHRADPFPVSVEGGTDYGEVEPVLIDADIFGWAETAARSARFAPSDRQPLKLARDRLARSLELVPDEAREYYGRLIRIADLTLDL